MGAAKQPGVSRLYGASGTGASLLENWAGASTIFQRVIPLTTIDILVSDRLAGKRLFIKIDVEGAEYEVLQGAQKTLQMRPKPKWLVEITLSEYHPQGVHPHYLQVFDLFWKYGYVATTANAEARSISRVDLERWVRQGHSESGVINYLFTAPVS